MQATLFFMLLGSGLTALASPLTPAAADNVYANHTAEGASTFNPHLATTESTSQKCISFTADVEKWYFANTGIWGSRTGTFASTGGKICVPTNNGAGGAMYIGPLANPGPGSTKLECFFPTSGTANCDASLVDGYSLSVTCKAGGQTIGGPTNLFTKNPCPHSQGPNCLNGKGYAPTQSDVNKFFQEGVKDGNKYCIWKNCKQDYYFEVTAPLSCHVSGF